MESLITTLFESIFLVKYRTECLNICIVIIHQNVLVLEFLLQLLFQQMMPLFHKLTFIILHNQQSTQILSLHYCHHNLISILNNRYNVPIFGTIYRQYIQKPQLPLYKVNS